MPGTSWPRIAALLLTLIGAGQTRQIGAQDVDFRVEHPSQRLEMIVSSSRIISMEGDIPRMLVNNPDVVRVVPLSPNQVQISATAPGVTQVNLWNKEGKAFTVDIVVFRDPRPLEMVLNSEFPKAAIRVRPLETSVILSGYVDRPEVISRVVAIASDYYPSVINNINVGGVQQVNLQVKVMEISRTKLRASGMDWNAIFGNDFVAQTANGLGNLAAVPAAAAGQVVGNGTETVRLGIVNNNSQFYAFIRFLSSRQLLRILAEPNLVTVSGRPASFNEGGEFPILVPSGLGTTTIEFKEFGTRVDFVPIVQGNGNIRLEVRPQVSELDNTKSVEINGITVPGLRSRFVDTAVEMRSGQTLALAGLIQNRTTAKKTGLPILMDLPWTGHFFRSIEEENEEIELLVLVTPRLVAAMDADQVPPVGPGELTTSPNDVDFYGRGHIEVPKCCPDRRCQYPDQPHNGTGAAPGPMLPDQIMPGQAIPGQALPGQAVPGQAIPGQAVPGQAVPGQYPPNGALPQETPIPSSSPFDVSQLSAPTYSPASARPYEMPTGQTYSVQPGPPSPSQNDASGTAGSSGAATQPELFGPSGYDDLN
jgi:pilus assembly protein CpaC